MSDNAKHNPENMRGNKRELVLAGRECVRVFWMPVLARGKLHVEMLGSDFPGDHVSGMQTFVHKLRVSLNSRFRDDQPDLVFVDRGGGFYQADGTITDEFKSALQEHDLTAFHGHDASVQPGSSGDLWLHETTVSWLRHRLAVTMPAEPWGETVEDFGARLKAATTYVNQHHDVKSLCEEMPQRMHDLVYETKGQRLGK